MKKEIEMALSFIEDRPLEADIIHFALTMTEEEKLGFMLAWNVFKDDETHHGNSTN